MSAALQTIARQCGTAVHLYVDAGVGGAVIEGDRALLGASGMAGEFGHMPFGDPAMRCRCGALGCWNTSLDGHAVARALGQAAPGDEVSYTRRVLAAAQAGRPAELAAMRAVARSFGRAPQAWSTRSTRTWSPSAGWGAICSRWSATTSSPACRDGLMRFRASPPPPLLPARLGGDAPVTGAAEDAFAAVLTDEGLRAWTARPGGQRSHAG